MKSTRPRSIGRYVLHAEIAAGGMATVHLGAIRGAEGFARAVAIKCPHAGLARDPEANVAFIDEARMASRIRHPNVVPTLDVVTEDGEIFLVMEYVHGVSLWDLLRESRTRGAKVPLAIVARVVADTLRGLHAAHEARDEQGQPLSMVHRDVSPQNVLVGVDGLARVMDFGVAKATGRLQTTTDGRLKGKLGYMAPEQIDNVELDRRTDVYASGVLLWQALTGKPLFSAGNEGALLAEVLSKKVEPPSSERAEVSSELDAITLRAVAREREQRFPTAEEFENALSAAVPPASAQEVGAWVKELAGEEIARREALLAELDSAVVAEPDQEATRAIGPVRSRFQKWSWILFAVLVIALGVFAVYPPRPKAPVAPAQNEVETTYREGMQALRDGASSVALQRFRRVVERDDGHAPAHLRIAVHSFFAAPAEAREHLLKATQQRASLGARDQALVEAFEPFILRQPSDYAEHEKRMTEAETRFPDDAETAFYVARAKTHRASFVEQRKQLERVLTLDPEFTLARAALAELELYSGELDRADRTIDACLSHTPSAAQCGASRVDIDKHLGRCDRLEAGASRLTVIDPAAATGYHALANALYATGRPDRAVRAALEQAWTRSDVLRSAPKLEDLVSLDVLKGDFEAGKKRAEELKRAVASSRARGVHAGVARLSIQILLETGDDKAAGAEAKRYLEERDGWLADPRREDFALSRDPAPYMLGVALRTGAMKKDAVERELDGYQKDWNQNILVGFRPFLWPHLFAVSVETPEAARAALEVLPSDLPLPRFHPLSFIGADVGRTFLLGDRLEQAVTWLREAASSCTAIDFPVAHTRVHYFLGLALEKKRDESGACVAYGVVLSRWGNAKPRSVSAELTRARVQALACPKSK